MRPETTKGWKMDAGPHTQVLFIPEDTESDVLAHAAILAMKWVDKDGQQHSQIIREWFDEG